MFGNVTSSWANPQPGQQQTSAFGTPSAFGAPNTTNAFGSTSAFGQPQQQTPAANPMFGNLSTPAANTGTTSAFGGGAFGNTAAAGTGAFGAKPAGTGFGAFGGGTGTGTTSAFGGTTGAFGQPAGATSNTGGLFGQPATSTTGTTSAFGGGSVFGQNKPTTSAFGTTALGTAAPPAVTTGTANPPWAAHHEKDGNQTAQYQSIVCMPAYAGYSFEELRVQDYAQGRKTASAAGTSAFGSTPSAFGPTPAAQPSTGLFGATPAQPTTSAFGTTPAAPTNNAFGAFGGTNTAQPAAGGGLFGGGGAFGSTPAQPATNSAFGGFGAQQQQQQQQQQQPSTGLFGGTGTFGANNNAPKPTGFGGFGTTPSTTGTTNNAFGGFGQTNTQAPAQPAAGTGLFGGTGTTTNNTFGGGAFGNNAAKPLFGTTNTTTPAPTNTFGGFGATQQPAQQQQGQTGTGLFGQPAGGGLFGQNNQQQQQPQANTGLFGATNTNTQPASGGLFGGGGGLFGNNNQQQQQQQQQPAGAGLFGAKPAAPAAGGGLFGGFGQTNTNATNANPGGGLFGGTGTFGQNNNNQQSTFGTGLFGNKPAAPSMGTAMSTGPSGGLFGSTAAGSNNAFGGSTAPQQNPLTASINQPIGSNLPIFSMLPPGPRLVDLDQSQPKKKAPFFVDIPTRAPAPRGPTNYAPTSSKLRGFGKSTALPGTGNPFTGSMLLNGKANALSLNESRAGSVGPDYLGRSGSPALGSGSRQSVKKVILDKKIEPSQLFVKSGSPVPGGKVVFSPALSIAARESEAAAAAAKNNQHDSPTPAPRAPPKKSGNKFTAAQTNKDAGERSGDPAHLEEGDYWVKPDLNSLKALGYDQLSAFKGLVVGRVGYGQIEFLEPVDLTGLPKLGALLGDVIHFEDQECSVYYDIDEADKPPPGSGLNVKARITLERCWPVDKSTREPIKDLDSPSVKKQQKRLRNMKGTTFESFDMDTGKWTFKVDHF